MRRIAVILAAASAALWLMRTKSFAGDAATAPSRPTTAATWPAVDPSSPLGKAAAEYRAYQVKLFQAAGTLAQAHARLDQADYEQAVSLHKAAKTLEAQAQRNLQEFERQMDALVAKPLKALDSDDFQVRQAATAELARLGIYALPALKKAIATAGPEAKNRLESLIAALAGMSIDQQGLLHQWASEATASSEYAQDQWSAMQAAGPPDTDADGDHATAWASKEADAGEEWLELTFDHAVRPAKVRVRETFNPGAVVKVEGKDDAGQWHTIWEGKDPTTQSPDYLEVAPKAAATWACRTIKITLDTKSVPGWNEIDAVELIGQPAGDLTASRPAAKTKPPLPSPAKLMGDERLR